MQRQKDQYQGVWIISPDGKVLSGLHDFKDAKTWPQELIDTMTAGLKSFGPVETRKAIASDPLPHRGVGIRHDGSVSLAMYSRYLHDDKPDGPPVIDTLTLTKAEWAAFLPPKLDEGTRWTIPDAVAKKLVRVLSPNSDQSTMPHPHEATVAELHGHVEANDGTHVRIRWTGKLEAKHLIEGDAKRVSFATAVVEGVGTADAATRSPEILLLVARCTYRHAAPYDQPRQAGSVMEWRRTAN